MTMMKSHVTSLNCRVDMTNAEFRRLMCIEFKHVESWFSRLDVSDLNYDGHFGASFFFTAKNDKTKERVAEILQKRLNGYIAPKHLDFEMTRLWQPELIKRGDK